MHSRNSLILSLLGAALLCGAVRAEVPVSAEFSVGIHSKTFYYGCVDINEPVLMTSGCLTFFDWVCIGTEAVFDLTHYGRRAGYSDRFFKCVELDPNASILHSFSPDDFAWLPTTVEIELNYTYEYMAWTRSSGWNRKEPDTQYWSFYMSFPDLWIEPRFCYERDTIRDNGTYLNLSVGHTFSLIDGDGKDSDPVLSLRPSIAQGFGNRARVRYYLWLDEETPLNHAGLMDTVVKLKLTWKVSEWLKFSAYVGYSDFLFDRRIREASRNYEATGDWTHSWNFIGGCAFTAEF